MRLRSSIKWSQNLLRPEDVDVSDSADDAREREPVPAGEDYVEEAESDDEDDDDSQQEDWVDEEAEEADEAEQGQPEPAPVADSVPCKKKRRKVLDEQSAVSVDQ